MKTKTKLILRAGLALLAVSISATWCLLAASNTGPGVNASENVTGTDVRTATALSQPVGKDSEAFDKMGIAAGIPHSVVKPAFSGQPFVPTSAPYSTGDVFVGVGSGFIKHFSPLGVLLDTLNTGTGCNEDLGMAFTSTSHLLATASFGTCFGSGTVTEFDDMGNLIGPFGSGYSASTESVVIDAAGNVYVGQPDGTMALKKFNSTGTFLMDFLPATQNRGTDWNDLAADQCTMFYTSEGDIIKRFDVCANTQLADFATSLASPKYALRIRSNGEVLVAATDVLERYDAGGTLIQTYTFPGTLAFAMNLDPDGTHFWTADYFTGTVYEYDISTGAIVSSFPSAPLTFASGLAVFGEQTAASSPTPSPSPTATATATATATSTPTPTPTATPSGVCPLTIGYWKNHPNAWPVNTLMLGSQTYTKTELLNILNNPGAGDASMILAVQLIAAKLNIANGSDPTPVSTTITHADSLLSMFSGKLPYHVKTSSAIGQMMVSDANTLDNYNNGKLTQHCSP